MRLRFFIKMPGRFWKTGSCEENMENQNEMDINLVDLFFYLKKKILLIAAVFVACAVVGFLGTKLLVENEYTASTRVYVLNRSSETTVVYSDYQISSKMLSDYKVLITGRNVTEEVISLLGLDWDDEDLARKISVTSPEDTQFVQINVTDTDPQRAADIANAVREVASVQIKELMDIEAVNLVYEAKVPKDPSGPNTMLNTVLAAGAGLILILAVLVLVFILDDTIRSEEDVERYLGLSVMGVIPDDEELGDLARKKSGTGAVKKAPSAAGKKK